MCKGKGGELVRPITGEILPPVRLSDPHELPAYMTQGQPIAIPALPQATHTAHMRETHDVRAAARVAERFIVWDMAIFGAITAALAGLIYYRIGGDSTLYALGWLVVWGSVSYLAMNRNRAQSYDHSPTGVARLEQQTQAAMYDRSAQVQEQEIASRERVALYAIDRHAALIEKRWQLERGDGNHE